MLVLPGDTQSMSCTLNLLHITRVLKQLLLKRDQNAAIVFLAEWLCDFVCLSYFRFALV